MFAQIVSSKPDTADLLFLIAAIVFGVAAVLHLLPRPINIPAALTAAAAALVAVGLLVL